MYIHFPPSTERRFGAINDSFSRTTTFTTESSRRYTRFGAHTEAVQFAVPAAEKHTISIAPALTIRGEYLAPTFEKLINFFTVN